MPLVKGREKFVVQLQPPQQIPSPVDQRILLIRTVRKYPSIYKNEFLRTPFLQRNEKQKLWDKIAEESGFEKTEDAKCKWRSLIGYLRQHLENVAQKKTRRYIPISDNPDDKYVQLSDWSFYSELEFLVPYVKYGASKQFSNSVKGLEITPSEIDLILEGIEAEIEKKNGKKETTSIAQVPENDLKQIQQPRGDVHEVENNFVEVSDDNVSTAVDLTENDKILKEYFENMLKSTLKLPRFHQNLIKQHLQDCINEQKALNKIN